MNHWRIMKNLLECTGGPNGIYFMDMLEAKRYLAGECPWFDENNKIVISNLQSQGIKFSDYKDIIEEGIVRG